MTSKKPLLLIVGLAAIAMLGAGLYLQLVEKMLPCPLCVLQRYAFAALAIFCLLGASVDGGARLSATILGVIAALSGAGVAIWHLYIKAHPGVSCGIDPLETSLNTIPMARLFPTLFQADGLCTTEYPPILGLSIPQWSLFWFVIFAIALVVALVRRRR
jgi:disulfide bond formation protein DsbB